MKRLGIMAFAGGLIWAATVRADEDRLLPHQRRQLVDLKDPDPGVRLQALQAFQGDADALKTRTVAVAIVGHVRDRDTSIRNEAVGVLRTKSEHADVVVPALVGALSDPCEEVRQFAAQGLKNYGGKAKEAIPQLLKMLADRDSYVTRSSASVGLGGVAGPTASKEVVAALIAASGDPDAGVRERTADALGAAAHGEQSAVALAALRKLLKDPASNVRSAAVNAMGSLFAGPEPQKQNPIAVLDGNDAGAKYDALRSVDDPGEALLNKIIALLRDKDARLAFEAANALSKVGPRAKAAVPVLIELLDTRDGFLQSRVIIALGAVGPDSAPAIPKLTRLLSSPDDSIADVAAEALGYIGPKSASAVPQLIRALQRPSYFARASAAEALGQIGVKGNDVLDALRTAEKDSADPVRRLATTSLEKLAGAEKKR